MPKSRNKVRDRLAKQKTIEGNVYGDLTVDDFANCTVKTGKGRLRKPACSSMAREVKQMCGASDTREWYEKDLEDFDIVLNPSDDEEEDLALKDKRKRKSRRKKKSNLDVVQESDEGMEYPLDVWFLISEYIQPEDVGRFAAICRGSLYVVNSAKFWLMTYKKYYRPISTIPERLQPQCMERLGGIKACVIRTLYYLYTPFVERLKVVEDQHHFLVKKRCIIMWHQKLDTEWHFYFKMQDPHINSTPLMTSQLPDLLEMLGDINTNSENGCMVLEVISPNYVSVPIVLGLTLSSATYSLSAQGSNMRNYCLRLVFVSPHYQGQNVKKQSQHSSATFVVFDPVAKLKVLNWWHPQYPHSIHVENSEISSDF